MKPISIPVAIVLMLAASTGIVSADWIVSPSTHQDVGNYFAQPYYFINFSGYQLSDGYHPLLGQTFIAKPMPLGKSSLSAPVRTGLQPVALGMVAKSSAIPYGQTFSQNWENNLQYAQTRSSLRIGQGSNWSTISTPWLIMERGWFGPSV
ncbi:MAG: hypothetical protein A4E45_01524 [Methanosaeta sp. PtaB.Bin039]|nr:MAG: hypothetical protein A4E45_01524 [Methanosaeta sp. PtaB.Bin039]HQF16936.1 hypothetical protein [Methanotrichaceae archaeon]HQI91503.1 hypothetical protein [Methanotrichaceae archaeon]HQJ28841.1 hypothetical protein [Methanotrichaceae archaeon]